MRCHNRFDINDGDDDDDNDDSNGDDDNGDGYGDDDGRRLQRHLSHIIASTTTTLCLVPGALRSYFDFVLKSCYIPSN